MFKYPINALIKGGVLNRMPRKIRKDEYLDKDNCIRRESDPTDRAFKSMDERAKRKSREILG